jgi:predicted dehydrogenase
VKKMKIAILGTSHPHALGFWKAFTSVPDEAEIIGWADVPPADGQEAAAKAKENLGEAAVRTLRRYDDYRRLLAEKPDLALISSANCAHGDIACETLSAGIPTVAEKPMAMNYSDAVRMAECAEKNGTMLAVNWPIAWFPSFTKAKEMIDEGRIGRLMRVVYRSPATWGPYSYRPDGKNPPDDFLSRTWWYRPEMGGGSLLDYACYGAALSTWYFGRRAERVCGIRKNFTLPGFGVEDYSAMLLDFGAGVGLLEGSWSTYNCGEIPSGPVAFGTEGTIVCDRHSSVLKLCAGRSHAMAAPSEVIDCGAGNPPLALARNLLDHIRLGTPLHPLLEAERNVSVMAALEAGRRSADSGVTVETARL